MTAVTVTPLPARRGTRARARRPCRRRCLRAAARRSAPSIDPSSTRRAAADPEAYWAEQARTLDWAVPFDPGARRVRPALRQVVRRRALNAAHNCLDRHVEAGLGDRVAFHWRGEEGEERDLTYADLLRDVQRFANALKDLGVGKGDVVGIYLPMIPEVVVAMLACARIGAPHNVVFGGFSAESVARAHGVLRGQGADHRRRRAAQGQDRADQARGRRAHGRADARSRRVVVVRHTGIDVADDARAATSATTSPARRPTPSARPSRWRPSTRCSSSTPPARRPSRRASCTPPAAT